MGKKKPVKLSDEELIEKIKKRESLEIKLKLYGMNGILFGLIGAAIFKFVGIETLMAFSLFVASAGLIALMAGVFQEKKTKSMVNEQMGDFYTAELKKAFGPPENTSEMLIDQGLMEELDPSDEAWEKCSVWRFYEGTYHETHFSVGNVDLYTETTDQDGTMKYSKFKGVVLRCKDVFAPDMDIFLRGSKLDHSQCDLTEPAIFRQYFPACTWDGQPADNLVTPELRELVRKLESFGSGYNVSRLRIRSGEAIVIVSGYVFGVDLPDTSLRDLDALRKRFTDSLVPAGKMIDALRECGGK